MIKQLLNKFLQNILCLMMSVLVTNYAVAGIHALSATYQSSEPLAITGSAKAICRYTSVSLIATACSGIPAWIGNLTPIGIFYATCAQKGCICSQPEKLSTDAVERSKPLVSASLNNEPTRVTLHSLLPRSFSPNGNGVDDWFVIQQLPLGVTAQLEVYNRWESVVYRNAVYKNDWGETEDQFVKTV